MINVQAEIDARRARAAVIAAGGHITELGGYWVVPSQTSGARYRVALEPNEAGEKRWTCNCDDFADRGALHPCKHVFAVEIVRTQASAPTTAAKVVRPTYRQEWSSYGEAQAHEKEYVTLLLRQLALATPELSKRDGPGRNRIPIADVVMAICMKVYIGSSGRRTRGDYVALVKLGLLSNVPAFNSVSRYMSSAAMTPILMALVERSAMPLAGFGTAHTFAIDSSGMGLRTFMPGYRAEKYGSPTPKLHGWAKLHVIVDHATQVVTAAIVEHGNSADAPNLLPLVEATLKSGFKVRRVVADKAYSAHAIHERLDELDIEPVIPFRAGTGDGQDAPESFKRAFIHFRYHEREFLQAYGARQSVESAFSSMKRVIADTVRARTPVAQVNEVLAIVVIHNLRKLVHAMIKMGFDPLDLKMAASM